MPLTTARRSRQTVKVYSDGVRALARWLDEQGESTEAGGRHHRQGRSR
jgi:hypothetical protein